MATEGPNLVFGSACNMPVPAVHIFVESLRRHFRGDVMMLVLSRGSEALINYLRSHDIIPIYFDCPIWMIMHVQLGRFVRFAETLRGVNKEYARVLLTDVADVVFQADPFAQLPDGDLLCFLEAAGRTIAQCKINSQWVQQIFGTSGWERIKDHEISCAGTTIGSHRAILQYIDLLLEQARPDLLIRLIGSRGHDQGIHNFLLRTGALPIARIIPNGQHVYTVGHVPDTEFTLEPGGIILAPGARRCPIVHQYNYKPAMLEHLQSAFPMPGT